MTTDHQKQHEVFFAQKAADKLGESWKIEPSMNESDWPDLIVSSDTGKFGLEVREIYLDELKKGSKKKANEIFNKNLLNSIINSYYQINSSSIKVNFLGDISNNDKIVKSVNREVPNLQEFEQKRISPYSECTAYITKLPDKVGKYTRWQYVSDQVGWVSTISTEIIDKIVYQKAMNLHKYAKNISDVRLLLVSNRSFNSGKATIDGNLKCNPYGFEEVYYFSYPLEIWKISS